jgi:hypothetical protein
MAMRKGSLNSQRKKVTSLSTVKKMAHHRYNSNEASKSMEVKFDSFGICSSSQVRA